MTSDKLFKNHQLSGEVQQICGEF